MFKKTMIKKITIGTGIGCLMIAAIAAERMGNWMLFWLFTSTVLLCESGALLDEKTGSDKLVKLDMVYHVCKIAFLVFVILMPF